MPAPAPPVVPAPAPTTIFSLASLAKPCPAPMPFTGPPVSNEARQAGRSKHCCKCRKWNEDPSQRTRGYCRDCNREMNRRQEARAKKKRERAKREAQRKRQERARVKAVQARLMEIDPGSALEEFRNALAFQFGDPDFFARQIVDLVNDSGSKRARFRAMCLIARLIDETGGVERYRDAAGTMAEQYGAG